MGGPRGWHHRRRENACAALRRGSTRRGHASGRPIVGEDDCLRSGDPRSPGSGDAGRQRGPGTATGGLRGCAHRSGRVRGRPRWQRPAPRGGGPVRRVSRAERPVRHRGPRTPRVVSGIRHDSGAARRRCRDDRRRDGRRPRSEHAQRRRLRDCGGDAQRRRARRSGHRLRLDGERRTPRGRRRPDGFRRSLPRVGRGRRGRRPVPGQRRRVPAHLRGRGRGVQRRDAGPEGSPARR